MSDYRSSHALQAAIKRITNPPSTFHDNVWKQVHYEHHVGSWACTMLKDVFKSPDWIITPERRDQYSNKKPDLIVEKVENDSIRLHLLMELKSNDKSIRFEDALSQVVKEIEETMEEIIECFVVVQCGTRIGFFEYHNDQSNLNEEGIPHFRGCVSVTEDYSIEGRMTSIMTNKPQDLQPLYHNHEKLRKKTDLREEARRYQTKCVFDLINHAEDVDKIFYHMANNPPRSSV